MDSSSGHPGALSLSTCTTSHRAALRPACSQRARSARALVLVSRFGGIRHARSTGSRSPTSVSQYVPAGKPEPKFEATLTDPSDVAFTSDGSMFVSDGPEIRRFAPDGGVATAYQGDKGEVTELAVGPDDDLYFVEPDTDQVRVLVKAPRAPDLADTPTASATLGWSIVGAIVVLIAAAIFVRHNRKRARPSTEAGT